jgi:two-component system cell cycle sensor histidine kinase/response regulator CckA
MEQVLLNLVVNARDAMPHGGTLRIATRLVDHLTPEDGGAGQRAVEVTVTDSGIGMTDDVRSRIFEPFFTTKGDEATGLGLASVYGIVTQTGGDIVCESAVGQGTRFRVSLPAAPPPREASPASTALGHGAHGREIVLLVEDESSVRELTARALREFGYKVLEAPDVDSALRYLEHPGLAVVVSDVVMPGRSGDDLSTEVMRRRPDLPVLLMTGCSEALLQRPVDPAHLLRKPFTPTDLVAKIRALLDRAPATSA